MEENKFLNNKLYMPSNISSEIEIIKGITKKEIKYLIYLELISLFVSFILSMFISFQIGVLIFILFSIFSYFLVAKNPYNYSTIKYIVGMYVYYTKQNNFKYKYKEWWERFIDEEK